MTLENKNAETLGKVEDSIFRMRQIAARNDDVEMYGKLDDTLLLVQYLGMGLKLERDNRRDAALTGGS
jgi:hypothetical protein